MRYYYEQEKKAKKDLKDIEDIFFKLTKFKKK